MRILVTGAAGAVGSYVPKVFADDELVLTDKRGDFRFLDVRDLDAVAATVADVKPDVVLHLAAATDVDKCERDTDYAFSNNAIGTQAVALACRDAGCELVYISTAGVFWGDKPEPYTEFDEPRPANVYGVSKLFGERIVESLCDRYFIVRAGWMVGGGVLDRKFVGKISEQLRGGATHLKAVDDKFGSPTYAPDLLRAIQRLLGTGWHGLYHSVNKGTCTRHDVAVELAKILGREDVEIERVSSAEFPLPAPRARSEAMRNYRLELVGLDEAPPWQEALHEYVTTELVAALEL
ncbi:MAG TPA: dTDP-4-dehydrorhamnose reductase, partial [Gaiellaceae bacterium]|nr:dTDP-4-dehydrorhamnose reductase [Gaiellaceae bacterium]